MLQRFPPGKGNRHQRNAEAKGVRGTNRTEQLLMTPEGRRGESPRTWNIVGSRQVYFCRLDRLPGALSDGKLLYCLTRKGIKKAKGREGEGWMRKGVLAWELSNPLAVLSPGDETQSEAGMWWRLVYGQAYFSIVLCRFEIQFNSSLLSVRHFLFKHWLTNLGRFILSLRCFHEPRPLIIDMKK